MQQQILFFSHEQDKHYQTCLKVYTIEKLSGESYLFLEVYQYQNLLKSNVSYNKIM